MIKAHLQLAKLFRNRFYLTVLCRSNRRTSFVFVLALCPRRSGFQQPVRSGNTLWLQAGQFRRFPSRGWKWDRLQAAFTRECLSVFLFTRRENRSKKPGDAAWISNRILSGKYEGYLTSSTGILLALLLVGVDHWRSTALLSLPFLLSTIDTQYWANRRFWRSFCLIRFDFLSELDHILTIGARSIYFS